MTAPKVTWQKDMADAALAPYRDAVRFATCWGEGDELAALFLHVNRVPGMCPSEKLVSLYHVMKTCPPGDVVEIGTWWGKSALALLLLSRRYGIGNVLCVDPWKDEELVQGVPHVDEASAALSAEEAFEVFKMSLLPYCYNEEDTEPDFNYLRLTSESARLGYGKGHETSEFGDTCYAGRIAILHIDGNHAYEKVRQDVELWAPLVVPGGWVVIDDYDWRHGDGPKRAADELIAAGCEQNFLAGGAMFVQKNKGHR